jgi:nitrogen fixation NifU-like protein
MSAEIYRDLILDHYRNPHNFGEMSNPDVRVKDSNPLCGDVIEMQLKIGNHTLEDVKFRGSGCAISQASASMLTDAVKGKTLEEVKQMNKKTILDLMGIELGPTRIKCALLSLKVIKLGVYSYLGQALSEDDEHLL